MDNMDDLDDDFLYEEEEPLSDREGEIYREAFYAVYLALLPAIEQLEEAPPSPAVERTKSALRAAWKKAVKALGGGGLG